MSRKRPAAAAEDAGAEESPSKAELRREMEATRESISDTVAEIKSVVAQQYEEVRGTVETVKQEVNEVIDWRTEFERNPLVWGAGAVSVGILIGFGIAKAFDEEDSRGRGRRKKASTGGYVVAELSGLADLVLPTISSKVKELFGLDLDAYLRAAHESRPARAREKAATKRVGAGKSAAKKRDAKKGAPKPRRASSASSKRGTS